MPAIAAMIPMPVAKSERLIDSEKSSAEEGSPWLISEKTPSMEMIESTIPSKGTICRQAPNVAKRCPGGHPSLLFRLRYWDSKSRCSAGAMDY